MPTKPGKNTQKDASHSNSGKMMRATSNGIKLINRAVQEAGSQNKFAKLTYFSPASLSRFLQGTPLLDETCEEIAKAANLLVEDIAEPVSIAELEAWKAEQSSKTSIHNNLCQLTSAPFVGRDVALSELHDQLQQKPHPAIIAIHGAIGVGKSELALRYAWKFLPDYPGGICWVNALEGDLASALLQEIKPFVSQSPSKDDSPAAQVSFCWRHWDGGDKPVLVVLDDVQNYDELGEFLKGLPSRFQVLVTAREAPSQQGIYRNFFLPPLAIEDAQNLFLALIEGDERLTEDGADIDALCKWLDCLPLAIYLVGSYLQWDQDIAIAELYQRLQQNAIRDEAFAATRFATVRQGVIAAFDLTWELLGQSEQNLGCLISLFAPLPFAWEWVEQANAQSGLFANLSTARGILVKLHLLEREERGIYRMYSLTRQYFQERCIALNVLGDLQQSVCRALMQTVHNVNLPERPTEDQIQAFTFVAPHLEKALLLFAAAFDDMDLLLAVTGVRRFYQGQGFYQQALNLCLALLPIFESRFDSASLHASTLYNNIGRLLFFQNDFPAAQEWLSKALVSAEAVGEDLQLAKVLQNLAAIYRDTAEDADDLANAEATAKRGLAIQERHLGDHLDTAHSAMTLATILLYAERYDEAEPVLREVLRVQESFADPNNPDIGETLNGLGYLHEKLGNASKAEDFHSRTLEFRKRIHGERHPQTAESYNNLGKVYVALARFSEAQTAYESAISIFSDSSYQENYAPQHGWCLKNLGELYGQIGKQEHACNVLREAIEIIEKYCGKDHQMTHSCYKSLSRLSQK